MMESSRSAIASPRRPGRLARPSIRGFLLASAFLPALLTAASAQPGFTHPGCLSTRADLERMRAKVAAGEQPWKGSWDILVGNTDGFLDDSPEVQPRIKAGGGGENYMRLARDAARAYQLALRFRISGDERFGDRAVTIFNAWAEQHEGWDGDSNVRLRAGLYGYQFACAAELMRDYPGWKPREFRAFQDYMRRDFLSHNMDFLENRHGTVPTHYWANWVQANQASMMAIGVLCDDRAIFDRAVDYFHNGSGNENIGKAVVFVHPNGLGQWQESGRDQGHSVMGPMLLGTICEIAWNQGIDLYGARLNRPLAGVEYVSKYNLGHEVPFVTYVYAHGHPGREQYWVQNEISSHARGTRRPGWDLIYHHYVNRRGLSAPWTGRYAETVRPDGGGFNYGGSSGGFDGLGFTTLTHSLDPIAEGAAPGALRPHVEGRQVTLSWSGSAHATSYNVKRATSEAGPYETLATVRPPLQHHVDSGLRAGTTYHYVVSANTPHGESADSEPAAATADGRLRGSIIGTDGSHKGSGADKRTVFDGYLDNYFDPPVRDAWVGLDLGEGVEAVVTGVKYCPRRNAAERMVGGTFQGSDTADFSAGVVDLFTIRTQPEEGVLTARDVAEAGDAGGFRYLRYIPTEGERWCNVAEIQFLGEVRGLHPPVAPEAPEAARVGATEVELSWRAVPDADSYRVKRLAPDGGPEVIIANVTGTTHREVGLKPGLACRFAVSAVNSAGESANSSPVSRRPGRD